MTYEIGLNEHEKRVLRFVCGRQVPALYLTAIVREHLLEKFDEAMTALQGGTQEPPPEPSPSAAIEAAVAEAVNEEDEGDDEPEPETKPKKRKKQNFKLYTCKVCGEATSSHKYAEHMRKCLIATGHTVYEAMENWKGHNHKVPPGLVVTDLGKHEVAVQRSRVGYLAFLMESAENRFLAEVNTERRSLLREKNGLRLLHTEMTKARLRWGTADGRRITTLSHCTNEARDLAWHSIPMGKKREMCLAHRIDPKFERHPTTRKMHEGTRVRLERRGIISDAPMCRSKNKAARE